MKPLFVAAAIAAVCATAAHAEESERSDLEGSPSANSPSLFDPPEFVLKVPDYFVPLRPGDDSDGGDAGPQANEGASLGASREADDSDGGDPGGGGGFLVRAGAMVASAVRHARGGCGDPQCTGGCQDGCYVPPTCKRPGEITFKPGLRLQPRYDNVADDNDFFIRRFRLKGSGKVYDVAMYGAELKVDSSERFDVGNPTPVVENAWLDFTVLKDEAYLKVGLYDIPFSRNALTSDSKLLLMDRSLIKEALTKVGMADNTVGVMLHGRPRGGKLEYSAGVFDAIAFDRTGKNSHDLMPAGRIAWYLLDPAIGGSTSDLSDGYADYRESYLGKGERLVLAANVATLPHVVQGASEFNLTAWGVDAFFNKGRYVLQAEYDWFTEDGSDGTPDFVGDGWYVQGGYILNCCWELVARYQRLSDPLNPVNSSQRVAWTSVGVNYYIHEHNLKVQADYTWKNEEAQEIRNDVFEIQLQLDF